MSIMVFWIATLLVMTVQVEKFLAQDDKLCLRSALETIFWSVVLQLGKIRRE